MPDTVPLSFEPVADGEARARAFRERMAQRRTVREFSSRAVPQSIIEEAIRAAGSAPSGANQQPWHFVAVSTADAANWIADWRSDEDAVRIGLDAEALRVETDGAIAGWNEIGRAMAGRFLEAAATRA